MDDKYYFVMFYDINDVSGSFTPLMESNYDIARFSTKEEAETEGFKNPLGKSFGFEVFCIGKGE